MATDTKSTGRTWVISGSRVWTIATSTFTQLVRMKTFYFLLAFAFLLMVVGNLDMVMSPAQQLSMIKKVSFGTMNIFSWLFAIIATALLIPKDLEDRTLYTILSKPVLRIEYLIGKLIGVLIVIGLSLIFMFVIFSGILHLRTMAFANSEISYLQSAGRSAEQIAIEIDAITSQGVRAELWIAVWAMFLKSAIVASTTIFLSSFASSSLFTIIISALIFLVGHFREMATSFWERESDGNLAVSLVAKLFKIFIPDYQLFEFSEGIILGEKIVPLLVWSMTGMSIFYAVFFLMLALLVFFDKEF